MEDPRNIRQGLEGPGQTGGDKAPDRRLKMSGWLQTALDRVRDFAYTVPPPIEAPGAPPKIGLALGGGFARGIAHLGVLHALQQNNIPIHCIAGTSAGALAAVAYASGLPFDEVVRKATALKFGNFAQWRFSKMGLASNQRLALYPQLTLGVSDFKELKIPLVIVAADLYTGEPVYMSEGPIGPALRASCAYPGLFRPVEYQGHLLVDGFVAATVPVDAARFMGADIVIAVFLDGESAHRPSNVTDVIGRSFAIVQRRADSGWRAKADVVIEPNVRDFTWDDFAKTPELVAAGEQATLEALPRIMAAMRPVSPAAAGSVPAAGPVSIASVGKDGRGRGAGRVAGPVVVPKRQ
jgi:NTE family protein